MKERRSHRSLRTDDSPSIAPQKVLLYVEDNDDNWDVAEYRLSAHYQLVRAQTAEQACRIVRERHAEIDCILMDIELRGSELNGVELTEVLRGNGARLAFKVPSYAAQLPYFAKPVIYLTAHGKRYTRVELMLTGAEKVMEKPVSFAALREQLEELLGASTAGGTL